MKRSSFQLELPERYIAKYPLKRRENARLMVVHRNTGKIEHLQFSDIINFIDKEYALVLNNSKVFSAEIYGYKERTQASIQALLLRELDGKNNLWNAIINPARKIRVGNKLYFGDYSLMEELDKEIAHGSSIEKLDNLIDKEDAYTLVGEVIDNTTSRERIIVLSSKTDQPIYDVLEKIGRSPLPAVLKRKAEPIDKERYQTVYAKNIGSTLVPDGGIHFTPYILKQFELQDVEMPMITIHTGIRTLEPLIIQDLARHTLNSEYFEITPKAADTINKKLDNKQKVCAVGVCTLKALESAKAGERSVKSIQSWTNKFIHPPYKTSIVDALLTNFHLPNTTPFINTLAFGGHELMMEVYTTAIEENYRFFIYGDALLIL